ncbi:MAG: sugar transferase [Deltaproteobacteria bacterium]|nr:MAG: sugar transferase [Deltaproteobacteria bacterium]
MTTARTYYFKILLLVADLAAFLAALGAAVWVRYEFNPGWFEPGQAPWPALLAVLPYALGVWGLSLWVTGSYRLGLSSLEELWRLGRAVLATFLLLGAATFFYRDFSYSRAVVLLMIPLVFSGSVLARAIARFLWHQVLQLDPVQGRALVVGTGPMARHLARSMRGTRSDYTVEGMLACPEAGDRSGPQAPSPAPAEAAGARSRPGEPDAAVSVPATGGEGLPELPILGTLDDLDRLLASGRFKAVFVADGGLRREAQMEIAERCLRYNAQYQVVPDIYELMLDRVEVRLVGGLPMLALRQNKITGVNFLIKRVFDLVVSSLLLVLASPVMLATAIGIKLSSRGPVFFTQERVGLNGRTFKVIKFRSMHAGAPEDQVKEYARRWITQDAAAVEDGGKKLYKNARDPRIFPFGAFIRKYSIDELPQLFNVLKGEMSLIGPRPPIPYEVEVYRDWHRRRFETLPGITGLWQVSGRNRLSFDEMVRLDIEYIENWSLELDLKITLKTVGEVLSGGGI